MIFLGFAEKKKGAKGRSVYICRGMLAKPHEHTPRMDWGTQIHAQPQALTGSKGRSPLRKKYFPLLGGGRVRAYRHD